MIRFKADQLPEESEGILIDITFLYEPLFLHESQFPLQCSLMQELEIDIAFCLSGSRVIGDIPILLREFRQCIHL